MMTLPPARTEGSETAIGVDIGGTKIAAGIVRVSDGFVLVRRLTPTAPERGGDAVLADVIAVVKSLQIEAASFGAAPGVVGLGVPELVSPDGRMLSSATLTWKGASAADAIQGAVGVPALVEADVRAAARAEAVFGAGRGHASFLYVTVGTGISASLVLDGSPFVGARGLTGTFGSGRGLIPSDDGSLASGPPLEQFAAGPALAARFTAQCGIAADAYEVVRRCEAGEEPARGIVASAGEALGAAAAHLVNVLDPEVVVLGGGLGLVGGVYRQSIERAMRAYVWSEIHRNLPLVSAKLGIDAGLIGAALAAGSPHCVTESKAC